MASSRAPLPDKTLRVVLEVSRRRVSGYSCTNYYGNHFFCDLNLSLTTDRYRKDPGGYELCAKCGKVLSADKSTPDVYLRVPIFDGRLYEYACQDCDKPVKDLIFTYPHLEPTIKLLLKVHRKYLDWLFGIPKFRRQPGTWGKLRAAQRHIECCRCPFLSIEHRKGTVDSADTVSLSDGIRTCGLVAPFGKKYEEAFVQIDHENWLRSARYQGLWFRPPDWHLTDKYPCPDLRAQLKCVTYGRTEHIFGGMDVREFVERVETRTQWSYSREFDRAATRREAHIDRAEEDEGDTERHETRDDWRSTVREDSEDLTYIPYYSDIAEGNLPTEDKEQWIAEEQIPDNLRIDAAQEVSDVLRGKNDYSRWKTKILLALPRQEHPKELLRAFTPTGGKLTDAVEKLESWRLYDPFFECNVSNPRKVKLKRFYDPNDCDPWRSVLGEWLDRVPREYYTWGTYPKYESNKHYLVSLIAIAPKRISVFPRTAETKDIVCRSQPNMSCPVSGFERNDGFIAPGSSVQPCWGHYSRFLKVWMLPCSHQQRHEKDEVKVITMIQKETSERLDTSNGDYGMAWAKLCSAKSHPIASRNGRCDAGKHSIEPFVEACRECRYGSVWVDTR